jgi:hypothetical protein
MFLFPSETYAQIKGKIQETHTKIPLPFVHIVINNGEKQYLSDIDGNFEIPEDSSIKKILFKTYFHHDVVLPADSITDSLSLSISMNTYLHFQLSECTTDTSASIINEVILNKKKNEIGHLKYTSFSSYNKTTLTPERIEKANKSMGKLFRFFSLKFENFKEKQHFLIIESVTEKKYLNKRNQKEIITGAKSTILDVPSLFVQTTQFQSFSVYNNHLSVGGKTYISPLANRALSRYAFSTLDTIYTGNDTIYVVKFNPLPKKNFEGLKGLLFINKNNYAVNYFIASPAVEVKLNMTTYQSFKYYPEYKVWFPDRAKTIASVEKSGERFTAILNTYIFDVDLNTFLNKKIFDEVTLEYPYEAINKDEEFWKEKRRESLTPYDSNTYIYYDSADQKKFIYRTLKFGEHLYHWRIPYKFIDIDLKRIVDLNRFEGVRIGFGAHTNEKFSDKYILGGYIGYGTKDTDFKYGGDFTYKLRKAPISWTTAFSNDVEEAGGVNFPYNRNQYSSESLRRIRLLIMDKVMKWENSLNFHPFKYLDTRIAVNISRHRPTYDYHYKDEPDNIFYFTEVKLGFRYAYGEQFMQLLSKKIHHGSLYPVFYFNYTRGLDNVFSGEYNYHKYDLKLEYSIKLLDFGKTGIQVVTGLVKGNVPYTKLYNGHGSLRNPSVVVQNSFETMRYNEFLSDRYASIFVSHNFGRLYYKSRFIKPSLLLVYNLGYGSLNNSENHKDIIFKTMGKGFSESGILIDKIFALKLAGLNIGLGAGVFLRHGPYALPEFKDNFVFKFAISFGL